MLPRKEIASVKRYRVAYIFDPNRAEMRSRQIKGWVFTHFSLAGVGLDELSVVSFNCRHDGGSVHRLNEALGQAKDGNFEAIIVSESLGQAQWKKVAIFCLSYDIPLLLKREPSGNNEDGKSREGSLHLCQVCFGPNISQRIAALKAAAVVAA